MGQSIFNKDVNNDYIDKLDEGFLGAGSEMSHGLKTIFRFGKHIGKTMQEVADSDPQYILWLMENNEKFYITETVFERVEQFSQKYNQEKILRKILRRM